MGKNVKTFQMAPITAIPAVTVFQPDALTPASFGRPPRENDTFAGDPIETTMRVRYCRARVARSGNRAAARRLLCRKLEALIEAFEAPGRQSSRTGTGRPGR